MKKVIFSGGFDPIHLGHINMALVAKNTLDAEVIFVPAKVAIWKKDSISPEHKLNMVKLAIDGYNGFSYDTYELTSENQPYSFETVSYFKKKYPNDTLYLLIGQDQVNSFHLWKKPEEIAKMAQIIYFKRPKYELNLQNVDTYHMQALEGEEIEVSSSDVRSLNSVRVPEAVLKYIEDNSLYFIEKIRRYIDEKRFNHCLSVARLAYQIAKKNNFDSQKAYIAGLLHDIAKGINKNDALSMMKRYYPDFVEIGAFSYHQFLGEKIAKDDFNVIDEDILGAIKYHTTGKADMTILEKIVYAADKIDPTRGYDSKDLIEAMNNSVDEGFLTVLKANAEFLSNKEVSARNRLTDECFKCYLN